MSGGFQGLRVEGMRSCLMGREFQFYKIKRLLWMDGGEDITVLIYLMPLNYILKKWSRR